MKVDPDFRHAQSGDDVGAGIKKRPLVILAIGILCAGIAAYIGSAALHSSKSNLLTPHDLAQLDQEGESLVRRLEQEPCNSTLATQLATKLIEQNEYTATINFYQNQTSKCGASNDLLPMVYSAQEGLSRFADAKKTADSLVADYPAGPTTFGWRAQAEEKIGNLQSAYADMQQALLLFPDPANVDGSVYYDTAQLAEKTGHPCDAVATLRDYVAYDARERRTQQTNTIMQGWQKEGGCASLAGTGFTTIHYDKHGASITVPVEINGVTANMIVDTGATVTMLTPGFAKRAGVKSTVQGSGAVSTANGMTWAAGGRAESIVVGNASLKEVPVIIQDMKGGSSDEGIDGLLGLSFLGNFQVRFNDGTLELKPLQ